MLNRQKDYLLIGIVSFSLLAFEFLLSKELMFLFPDMTLSYWAVSLVILGFSLGSAISRIKFLNKISQERLIFLYIIVMVFSLFLLVKFSNIVIPLYGVPIFSTSLELLIMLAWPFIILGLYFGRVYSELKNLSMVFLSNGFGLALGAICSGKIYRFFGWPGGIFFIIFLLLVFLILFDKKKFVFYILTMCTFLFIYKAGFLKTDWSKKFDHYYYTKNAKNVITRYSDLTRVDVLKLSEGRGYVIFNDGGAPTWITSVSKSDNLYQVRRKDDQGVPFLLGDYQRVLIIGSGGGNDIYRALKAGSRNIKAVELNSATIHLMQNEFREYSGNIYFHPNVEVVEQEGRDYVRHTKERFDLIILRGTDTVTYFSSLSPFTLESYLYTKEALKRYFDILSQDGCLMIFRPTVSIDRTIGTSNKLLETLRLYKLLETLRLYNLIEILNLKEHAVIIQNNVQQADNSVTSVTSFLFKNKFNEDLLSKFEPTDELLYSPSRRTHIMRCLEDIYKRKFNINYLIDDRPLLYDFVKWQKMILLILKFFCIICSPVIVLLLLKKANFKKTIFYLLLGIAYIALELNLMGKLVLFLGNPVYPIQVVLASFLLFGGGGGYWGARRKLNIKGYLFLLVFLSLSLIFVFRWLYTLNISSQILRNVLAFLLVAPIGFFSAVPFSQALSREEKRHVMYALDGIGTVLGTVLIIFIQVYCGFNLGFIFIALVYFLIIF